MRLTRQTDYALRIMIYLSVHPEVWTPTPQIAQVYGISAHHVSKVAKDLVTRGYLSARRGQAGGLQLAVEPEALRLGDLIKTLEPSMELMECFNDATNQCCLSPVCGLRFGLMKAQRAFIDTLNAYTLADLTRNRAALAPLLAMPLQATARAS